MTATYIVISDPPTPAHDKTGRLQDLGGGDLRYTHTETGDKGERVNEGGER